MRIRLLPVAAIITVFAGCTDGDRPEANPRPNAVSSGQGSGVVLTAAPLEGVVSTVEPILVELTIHNGSTSTFRFRPMFFLGGRLRAEILDAEGQLVPPSADVMPPVEPFLDLQPGRSVVDTVDLRCARPSVAPRCTEVYDLSRYGRYEVRIEFDPICEGEGCRESLPLRSNWFVIDVAR